MKQVLDFLTANKVFYLATVDGDQARVRPFGFIMEWEGRLTFCTSNQKPMYRQMVISPNVEICCMDSGMNYLRVTGKAVFVTSDAAQARALEVMPGLAHLYAVGDGKFEIFSLVDAKATCANLNGETKILEC